MDPVRFGILGVGRIARNAVCPALAKADGATLLAAASRNVERAAAVGAARAYEDYLALLDDPEVEAVYIATHNGLHCPLTLQALQVLRQTVVAQFSNHVSQRLSTNGFFSEPAAKHAIFILEVTPSTHSLSLYPCFYWVFFKQANYGALII